MSPEPINLQVNILQVPEVARQTATVQQVAAHQKMAQEIQRAKDSQEEPETVQTTPEAEGAKLSKDGSGRGRAFLKPGGERKEAEEEAEGEEPKPADPGKGSRVDFTR